MASNYSHDQLRGAIAAAKAAGDTDAVAALEGELSALAPADPREKMGFFGKIGETITGKERMTDTVRSLPPITQMPELNQLNWNVAKTALGTLFSGTDEDAKIMANNFGLEHRQDEKGNHILRSRIDGKEYAFQPGLGLTDAPAAVGTVAAFTPAGRLATIPGMAAGAAATQGAIEATQAATGGEFNTGDVLVAGAAGGAIPLAGKAIRAGVVEPAKKLIQSARPQQAAQAAETAAGQPGTAVADITKEEAEALALQAGKGGIKSPAARERLAQAAKINPQAAKQAEELGIEVPPDVFSDSAQIRSLAGLSRSVVGSDAQAAWQETHRAAVQRADELLKEVDGVFVGEGPSMGVVSERVRNSLTKEHATLGAQAKELYAKVDAQVPKTAAVQTNNLKSALEQIKAEVGEGGLSGQEKRLMAMLGDNPTYGRLMREKDLIGQAIGGKQSPYGDMQSGALKRLYGALAQDQLDTIESVGGETLRQELRTANLLTAKQKALGDRITHVFGNDMEGSIANAMKSAVANASGGDSAKFMRIMKTIPPELRRETIVTALAQATRGKGADGGFGFAQFAKMYGGLRSNSPVYKQIVDELGPEAHQMMTSLYGFSKRMAEANANVLHTGKANQAFANVDTLIGRVLKSPFAKPVAIVASGADGGVTTGAMAAGLMTTLKNTSASAHKTAIENTGKLFASPEFQKLAIEMGAGNVSRETSAKVIASRAFMDFAKSARIAPDQRERWLLGVTQPSTNTSQVPKE